MEYLIIIFIWLISYSFLFLKNEIYTILTNFTIVENIVFFSSILVSVILLIIYIKISRKEVVKVNEPIESFHIKNEEVWSDIKLFIEFSISIGILGYLINDYTYLSFIPILLVLYRGILFSQFNVDKLPLIKEFKVRDYFNCLIGKTKTYYCFRSLSRIGTIKEYITKDGKIYVEKKYFDLRYSLKEYSQCKYKKLPNEIKFKVVKNKILFTCLNVGPFLISVLIFWIFLR